MLDQADGYMTADGRQIGPVVMEMKNITLRFGGVEAIKNISFDIREGEVRAIIGPNGAGKSSMLNVISGFYVPQDGQVLYKGVQRPQMRPYQVAQQGIARTFQNIALFEGMSVLDNVMTGRLTHMKTGMFSQALWKGRAEKEETANREVAERIIDFLEIEQFRYSYIMSLPYGVQKRVELGRALAMNPDLLLLDEPAAGMNNEETEDIARFIIDIHEEMKKTIIMVDHDMNMIMDIAEEVMVLNFGEKLAEGVPNEIVKDKKVIDAYLGVS